MGYYDEDELDKDITSPEEHRLSLFDSLKNRFGKKKEQTVSSEDEDSYGSYMASETPSETDSTVVKRARVETRNFEWWELLILLLEVFLLVYTILTFIFPGLLF